MSFISMTGNVLFTMALESGKGGPVQSIDSLKSLIPLFIHIFLNG